MHDYHYERGRVKYNYNALPIFFTYHRLVIHKKKRVNYTNIFGCLILGSHTSGGQTVGANC
jgi:hypothetical protein